MTHKDRQKDRKPYRKLNLG